MHTGPVIREALYASRQRTILMDKRSALMAVLALAIVLVIALVVKPQLTGKPVDTSITVPFVPTPTTEPTRIPTTLATPGSVPVSTPATAPTAYPTWDGKSKDLGVAPAAVTTPPGHGLPQLPETTIPEPGMVTYATIKGERGGTTEAIRMPFPYWELEYTVEPWERYVATMETPKSDSVAGFTASEVFPSFSIQVRDAAHPEQTIRTVQPQGGLDPDLWEKGEEYDPRPWVEKFYEERGDRSYFFVIEPHMISSYEIKVRVPAQYIGRY